MFTFHSSMIVMKVTCMFAIEVLHATIINRKLQSHSQFRSVLLLEYMFCTVASKLQCNRAREGNFRNASDLASCY